MKTILKITALVAFIAAVALPARAATYAIGKSFWVFADTNLITTVTNLGSAADVRQVTDFLLEVTVVGTNATMGGTIDIVWDTSGGGTYYGGLGPQTVGSHGWFSVPLTNSGTVRSTWTTNITVGSAGYWRLNYATNNAFQHLTNGAIRAYVKPQRTSRDY